MRGHGGATPTTGWHGGCSVRYSRCMSEIKDAFIIRAGAHSRHDSLLTLASRWRNGVTDLDVTCVFYALEAETVPFIQSLDGRWLPPAGLAGGVLRGINTSVVVREMIRTGLVRAWGPATRRRITPARVHLRDSVDRHVTACRDGVEGMREGRVRTVDDLTLVDCLECERAVALGSPRGL